VNESFQVQTFRNGLVLVAEPMGWLESAAFTLMVPAGCVYDPPRRGGLSSFASEMALRGSGPRDSRQFIADLDSLGVEWSDSVSDAHTRYSGATLAANLPAGLAIFADVVRRPHLPGEQLEAARQVLLQELRAVEDEPSQKVMLELHRHHYPDPWGRPPQGELAALEQTTLEEIREHFQRLYGPNDAILGVAGRFDWPRLEEAVGELLGDWEPRPSPPVVDGVNGRLHEHFPYDSSQTQIGIAYRGVPYRDPDYFRAWGSVGVLGSGMSSRLFTEVRKRRGLCYSVYATCHTLRDRGAVLCYAGTSAERAQQTLEVTLAEVARLYEGIGSEELDRLKARIKSALIMQQESSAARSWAIARDWYHLGRVRPLAELNRLMDDLTSREINEYLAAHPPGDFTVVTLGPRPLEVPGAVS